MRFLKIYLVCTFVQLSALTATGQVRFSGEIVASQDSVTIEIKNLWEAYLANSSNDAESSKYWLSESDIIQFYLSPDFKIYYIGEQVTFNIRPMVDDQIYEINTVSVVKSEDNSIEIPWIYKVCAKRTDQGYRLVNYFDATKHKLCHYPTTYIDYYYPASFHFDKESANKTSEFIEDFCVKFNPNYNTKIRYIAANSISEGNSLIGFIYSFADSPKQYAGYSIYPNTILSCRPDHIHELVHAIMMEKFPLAPMLLHEGIATYYGGASNNSYEYHVDNLRKYLNSGDDIGFADLESLQRNIEGETNLFYITGALVINHALKEYGTDKVLRLFSYIDTQEMFLKEFGVEKEKISSFIKSLINR